MVDRSKADKEGEEIFKKEAGWLINLATKPFTFKYVRTIEEKRNAYKIDMLRRSMMETAKKGELTAERAENYHKDIQNLLNDLQKQQ